MIADEPRPTPGIGTPDTTLLDADAFHLAIISFIERELPLWRDRPNRPQLDDEPNLNQTLCVHLNSASFNSWKGSFLSSGAHRKKWGSFHRIEVQDNAGRPQTSKCHGE